MGQQVMERDQSHTSIATALPATRKTSLSLAMLEKASVDVPGMGSAYSGK